MENRKRNQARTARGIALLLLLALVLALVLALASCGGGATGTCTVVLQTAAGERTVYEVALDRVSGRGLPGALGQLKVEQGLSYRMNGTMLEEVGTLRNDAATSTYITVFTSVARDADVTIYTKTLDYDGKVLTSAGVGVEDMTLEDGALIVIAPVVW